MKYFYCYSPPLKNFFIENGEVFIMSSKNDKTNKRYWLFEGDDKLNSLLDRWKYKNT